MNIRWRKQCKKTMYTMTKKIIKGRETIRIIGCEWKMVKQRGTKREIARIHITLSGRKIQGSKKEKWMKERM